jgi:hypothetical protein
MSLIENTVDAIKLHGVGDFSVEELFTPADWDGFSVREKRGLGRAICFRVKKGLAYTENSVVEPIPDTTPQRYSKWDSTATSKTKGLPSNNLCS